MDRVIAELDHDFSNLASAWCVYTLVSDGFEISSDGSS
jgi:hypothetical protein